MPSISCPLCNANCPFPVTCRRPAWNNKPVSPRQDQMLAGPIGAEPSRKSLRAPPVLSLSRSGAGLFSHSSSFDHRCRPAFRAARDPASCGRRRRHKSGPGRAPPRPVCRAAGSQGLTPLQQPRLPSVRHGRGIFYTSCVPPSPDGPAYGAIPRAVSTDARRSANLSLPAWRPEAVRGRPEGKNGGVCKSRITSCRHRRNASCGHGRHAEKPARMCMSTRLNY